MTNINDIKCMPCMFMGLKSSYALCNPDGQIVEIYTELRSAKYMQEQYNQQNIIYEIVQHKYKIISNLGLV